MSLLSALAGLAFAGLADEVAVGDCRGAREADVSPHTRLAIAWCALQDDDAERALAVLPSATGVLASYEHRVRGEALGRLGRPTEAAAELERALDGTDAAEVRLALAEARVAAGDPRGIAGLRALVEHPVHGGPARLALGDAAPAEARAAWTEVWTDARPGGADAEAARKLAKLGVPVPDLASLEGRKLAFLRYQGLAARGRVEEAVDLLGAIRAAGGRFEPTTLARANLAARRYADALKSWAEACGPPETASCEARDLFDYALTHARAGAYDVAAGVYRRLMAQHPASDQADFASFKLGYMEYDRARCDDAERLLHAHAEGRPDSSRAAEALWFAARCAWRSERPADAVRDWRALVARYPGSDLAAGATYWLARASGDEAGLEQVLARWPETGWGWFAAERIGKRYPARAGGSAPAWPSALASLPAVQRADALRAQGFPAWARAELASLPVSDRAAALAVGHARLAAGDYRGAQAAAKPWCKEAPTDPVVRELCVPRPERAIVEPIAVKAGIHPSLPYAIMTAESNLDPSVTSAAGARGLMQIMPSLGAELHPTLSPNRPSDPDDLYRGPYNASLGVTELGSLLRRVGGQGLPAVIAGYNGGADAVQRWSSGGVRPLDEWAEDIGYGETRTYVRRVLGYLQRYRLAWGDPG